VGEFVPQPGEEVLCRHAHTKRELLKKLSYLAQPGDPAALEACLGFLKDGDRTVRTEAVIALNELIPRDSLLSFDCRADIIHALGRACMDWSTQVCWRGIVPHHLCMCRSCVSAMYSLFAAVPS
jgi:hypothetical protein